MKKKKKNSVILYLAISGIGATIGALTGFGLSFTALSPLVMGGIVGSITPALFTALCAGILLYEFRKKALLKRMIKCLCRFRYYHTCRCCNWSWPCCSYNGYFSRCNARNGIGSFSRCSNSAHSSNRRDVSSRKCYCTNS
ncbi:hypothetical protein wVul_0870 [Wolbachia endosymbiont of Armadillidium vulgare str. wVulC]|nr:hypothetical protein wVul_0870 [Wolbachia endosymbiont of Armadillidium vulgare str. wVulC]